MCLFTDVSCRCGRVNSWLMLTRGGGGDVCLFPDVSCRGGRVNSWLMLTRGWRRRVFIS